MKSKQLYHSDSSTEKTNASGQRLQSLENASRKDALQEDSPAQDWQWTSQSSSVSGANKKAGAKQKNTTKKVREDIKELGFSDNLFEKLYRKPKLMDAAFDVKPFSKPVQFFSKLSNSKLSDDVLERLPAEAGDHFSDLLDRFPSKKSTSEKARDGMRRTLEGMDFEDAQKAYEIRFQHQLLHDGDQYSNHVDNTDWSIPKVAEVWDQLDVLPEQDVSKNEEIDQMIAISGGGGWFSPAADVIAIGVEGSPDYMAHVVRHEVAHAVHDQKKAEIDAWLTNDIGFVPLPVNQQGYRTWISELGGFPATWTDASGVERPFDDIAKGEIVYILMTYIGRAFGPSRDDVTETLPAEFLPAWDAMPEAVKNAVKQSTTNWWDNHSNWQTGPNGKYFLNHWYGNPSYMSPRAETVVAATGRTYTAMSEKEFFANCYSEFFSNKDGFVDPQKWGGRLPDFVQHFFYSNLLDMQPYKGKKKGKKKNQKEPPKPTGMSGTP